MIGVTPLDVVRVRLQSQSLPQPIRSPSIPSSSSSPSTVPPTSSFSKLPSNLGISSCCREVFWVNNNATFCVASQTAGLSPTSTAASSVECAVEEIQRRQFTSTVDGLRKIARHEGLSTLLRGLSPTLVMAIPANVIYFAGYDWLRRSPQSPLAHNISDTYAPFLAGSISRVAAATVISPIEMFRTRLQASSHTPHSSSRSVFSETLMGISDMVHAQGYASLWRGFTLTLWRDVPFSGLYWWGYEAVRNGLTDARERQSHGRSAFDLSSPSTAISATTRSASRTRRQAQADHTVTLTDSFIAGASSGAIAAVLTTPFDVGKTRQQVLRHAGDRAGDVASSTLRPEDRSMPRFLWHIFKTEGMSGLWRGWAARCLKVAPACAIMISSYEVGKQMARGVNQRSDTDLAV